jgi:xeroderma pigmentosum group C-complementing protein
MDVVGLKPDTKVAGTPNHDVPRLSTKELPCSSVVAGNISTLSPVQSEVNTKDSFSMTKQQCNLGNVKSKSACKRNLSKNLSNCKDDQSASTSKDESSSGQCPLTSSSADIPKRKGDVEFELQLQMALSATAAEIQENKLAATSSQSTGTLLNSTPPLKKSRKNAEVASNSSAVWSRNGAPLYWAEVYCGGQTLTGRWVHVDAVNDIIDGERQVEAASAVCRKPLRYVVAFAGGGAKDVTRRFAFFRTHRFLPCAMTNIYSLRSDTSVGDFVLISDRREY